MTEQMPPGAGAPQDPPPGTPPPPGAPPPSYQPPPTGTAAQGPGGGITLNYSGMYSMKRNSEAVGSLTAGIVGLVLFCMVIPGIIGGVAAVLLANKAKRSIAASNGAESGEGMATAGLVLGIIDLALTALFVLGVINAITRATH